MNGGKSKVLGKEKCRILKEIRRKIADENDIPFVTEECTHKGNCKGTCPRCESELRYLEKQLARRAAIGKTVTLAALCTGMALTTSGCAPLKLVTNIISPSSGDDLSGAVPYYEPSPESEPDVEVESGEVEWPEGDIELTGEVAPWDEYDPDDDTDALPFNDEETEVFPDIELSGMVAYEDGF